MRSIGPSPLLAELGVDAGSSIRPPAARIDRLDLCQETRIGLGAGTWGPLAPGVEPAIELRCSADKLLDGDEVNIVSEAPGSQVLNATGCAVGFARTET